MSRVVCHASLGLHVFGLIVLSAVAHVADKPPTSLAAASQCDPDDRVHGAADGNRDALAFLQAETRVHSAGGLGRALAGSSSGLLVWELGPLEVNSAAVEDSPAKAATRAHPMLRPSDRIWQILPIIIIMVLSSNKVSQMLRTPEEFMGSKILEVVFVFALYLFSGPAVILVNKRLIKNHGLHCPIFLASIGNIFIAIVTRLMVASGSVKLENPTIEWKRYLRIVVPLSMFQFASNVLGLWAYQYISVPEIQILKCTTVVLVLLFGFIVGVERFNPLLLASVVVIAIGTALSALFEENHVGEWEINHGVLFGTVLCMLASAAEAARCVTAQVLMDVLPVFDALYWSCPVFVLLAVATSAPLEFHRLSELTWTPAMVRLLLSNTLLAGVVVLSNFWLVKIMGAVAVKIALNARNIGLILFSVLFTGEYCSKMQYVGYSLSLIGMGAYDAARQLDANSHKPILIPPKL